MIQCSVYKDLAYTQTDTQRFCYFIINNLFQGVNSEYQGAAGLLHDPEIEKKKKKITDKLNAIKTLKQQKAEGKKMENNQVNFKYFRRYIYYKLKNLNIFEKNNVFTKSGLLSKDTTIFEISG